MTKSPAVEVAQNGHFNIKEPVELSTGHVVMLKPVPAMLIEEAQSKIVDPPVPQQEVEGKEGLWDNPVDPDYIKAKSGIFRQRAQAGIDTMILFGVELVGGMPEGDGWLEKLRFMEKRGIIDLSEYDFEIPLEKEFIYKKFVVMGNDDWILLSEISGVSAEDIEEAKASFRSNETSGTD